MRKVINKSYLLKRDLVVSSATTFFNILDGQCMKLFVLPDKCIDFCCGEMHKLKFFVTEKMRDTKILKVRIHPVPQVFYSHLNWQCAIEDNCLLMEILMKEEVMIFFSNESCQNYAVAGEIHYKDCSSCVEVDL